MLNQAFISTYYRMYVDMEESDPVSGKEVVRALEGVHVLNYHDFNNASFKLGKATLATVDFYKFQIKQLREKEYALEVGV